MKKLLILMAMLLSACLISGTAFAAVSASWDSPISGQTYTVGTSLTVHGTAGAVGYTGGLDLALVLDSSGSMGSYGAQTAQQAAANALVNSLPTNGVSVAVIDFDSNSSADQPLGLTDISTAAGLTAVHTAINSINASGGTAIHAGIDAATATLIGSGHTAGREQVMIVMSDGGSTVSVADTAADNAAAAGVDAIHSVAMGADASAAALQAVVNGVDDIYGNEDDYGIYSSAAITELVALLTGGGLVGIDTVEITDGNNNAVPFTLSGLGNVSVDWTIGLGFNVLHMNVTGTDGLTAFAQWTATGVSGDTNPVPEPSTFILLGGGLAGLAFYRRKKAAN